MTDESPFPTTPAPETPKAAVKKKGGWPKGRPRMHKQTLSAEQVAAIADRAVATKRPGGLLTKMKATPNWDDDTAVAVGEEGLDRLNVPRDILQRLEAEGIVLQWITHSLRGMELPQAQAPFIKGGWTPVYQSDFDGMLDGLFMPKGMDEVIKVDDCMLVARPLAIHKKAKQRERMLAREPLMIKEASLGQGLPVSGGDHPSARSQNRIK